MAYYVCYDWQDLDAPKDEQKFGDHFSRFRTWPKAEVDTRDYIRNSMGRQKHKFDQGRIKIWKIWDVSEYAKLKNKFGPNKKIDDTIRPCIGHHIQADVHQIDKDTLIQRVNRELIKHKQRLPYLSFGQSQHDVIMEIKEALDNGKKTILAELCPRWRKTLPFSGGLLLETDFQLEIWTSYVLTSFTSVVTDLSNYEQFKDLVVIDSKLPTFRTDVRKALAAHRKVLVLVSMCSGENRQKRINYLYSLKAKKITISDEPDYGSHRPNQCRPLIKARGDSPVILIPGTNGERAASEWPIDYVIRVTYLELLMEKKAEKKNNFPISKLKNFKIDPKRDRCVVDVELYQADLRNLLETTRKADPNLFVENGIFAPSWSKFAADPVKAKGFWTHFLQASMEGKHNADELNVDLQTKRKPGENKKVEMIWLPGSITNRNLLLARDVAQEAVLGQKFIAITGAVGTTNRNAESKVKEEIENAQKEDKKLVLIASVMAQRSFSCIEVDTIHLCYDNGEIGATQQKISRALTYNKNDENKIGRVFSWSFDPNRDEKFDFILETAMNYNRNNKIKNLQTALKDVLKTIDIFRTTPEGPQKIEMTDTYLQELLSRDSINRVIGKTANLEKLTFSQIKAIAQGNVEIVTLTKQEKALKGKTWLTPNSRRKSQERTNKFFKLMAKAREVITTIAQNIDKFRFQGGKTLQEAFEIIDKYPKEEHEWIKQEFGLDYSIIKYLINNDIINQDLLDLKFSQSSKEK